MNRVKVTFLQASYTYEGATYGPFEASEEVPFLEVPEALANILNLPLYDGAAAEEGAAEGQSLLEANASLKADLDKATAEVAEQQGQITQLQIRLQSEADSYQTAARERDAARQELETAQREGNEAQAQVSTLNTDVARLGRELEAAHVETTERVQQLTQQAQSQDRVLAERISEIDGLKARILELEQNQIPADALKRVTDVKGVGEKLAPTIVAALTAPAIPPAAEGDPQ